MAGKIDCKVHGERQEAFVCSHLVGNSIGLGVNRDGADENNPFPDAWCDDCELIRVAHGGWTEESEKLLNVSLLCSGCYERVRIQNTRTAYTLEDMAGLRWKCRTCEEWHTGPCLDFGFDAPLFWRDSDRNMRVSSEPGPGSTLRKNFLSPDYCALDDEHFFVRGVLRLPIVGTAEHLCWRIWGSLSRENFDTLLKMDMIRSVSNCHPCSRG